MLAKLNGSITRISAVSTLFFAGIIKILFTMKRAVILTLAYLFATQLLFAQYSQSQPSNLAEGVAAILPEIPKVKKTTDLLSGNSIDLAKSDSPNHYLLPGAGKKLVEARIKAG